MGPRAGDCIKSGGGHAMLHELCPSGDFSDSDQETKAPNIGPRTMQAEKKRSVSGRRKFQRERMT